MLDNKMEVFDVDINTLVSPDYNPRKKLTPDDKEYQKIKASIETFGYADLAVVNKKNNVIIGGNQRVQVLKDLGVKTIKAVFVDLDETKEKALNIALNKITGEWDFAQLENLFNELQEVDFNLDLTGFEKFEIESLSTPIDWSDVDDLSEETYKEPEKTILECPFCHKQDSANHFRKIKGVLSDIQAQNDENKADDSEEEIKDIF